MNRRNFFGALLTLTVVGMATRSEPKLFPWQERILDAVRYKEQRFLFDRERLLNDWDRRRMPIGPTKEGT